MEGQISIFDIPGNETFAPEMWDCMNSCDNCGKYMDWFPIKSDGKRCVYGIHMDGTSGNDIVMKCDSHSVVHCWCRYYKPKEKKC